ncbi:hypothetical protein SprV_0301211700 [Sparganum proliferum]
MSNSDENASVLTRWCHLRDAVHSTALTVLGRARRQHQDWFDDNVVLISNLPAETNEPHSPYLNSPAYVNKAAYSQYRRFAQQRLREIQDAWTTRQTEEIQRYADRNESESFFAAIKAICGPQPKEPRHFSAAMDQRF